jgi:hypothetical protein
LFHPVPIDDPRRLVAATQAYIAYQARPPVRATAFVLIEPETVEIAGRQNGSSG